MEGSPLGCSGDGWVLPGSVPPAPCPEHRATPSSSVARGAPAPPLQKRGPTHGEGCASPRPLVNRVAPGDK